MPRLARKNLNSSFFHVMVQGINREYIFNTNENKDTYKEIIIDNYEDYDINILSYCLMSNHSHFLMFCEDFPILSKFMHKINTKYSLYYNKLHNRVGYVFRDRFKVQEIMDMDQLYNCLRYIHNNPVKANLCTSMDEYAYSSYNEFLGKQEIINNKSIELLFGCTENFENVFNMVHNNLSNDDFIDVENMTITEFVNIFLKENNVSLSELCNNNDKLTQFIKQAKKETNATLKDISELLDISEAKIGYHYRKKKDNSN